VSARLTVGFDAQVFLRQRRGGVSRMFTELMGELRARPDTDVVLPFRFAANEHLLESAPEVGRLAVPLRLAAPIGRPLSRRMRERATIDVLHHTFYDPAYLRDFPGAPRVVTVVDMIPELEGTGRAADEHLAKRAFVESCDAVICISVATRDAMLDVYGSVRAPVSVVPLGVAPAFFTEAQARGDHLLFVGERGGYKEFSVLLLALALLPPDLRGLPLLAVGGGPWNRDEERMIGRLGLTARQQALSDAELAVAYSRSAAFVAPARAEGFGLPVLEAMAAGCPVLLADTQVFREVGGSAAAYFQVGDAASLAAELEELLRRGDEDRDARVERASTFSWSSAAANTRDVYASVLRR
jgi:glycosyltransferase involved in cell wall biosynthesis